MSSLIERDPVRMQIMQGEPQHRLTSFVDEMLQRSRRVIAEMGDAMESMLSALLLSFTAFKESHYLITLDDVRFAQIAWMQDGRLLLTFGLGPSDGDVPKHAIIDEWADGVISRSKIPPEFRGECVNFLRGMVMQFAMLNKHTTIDLRAVAFDAPQWINDRQLIIGIRNAGALLKPRDVRID